MVGCEHAGIFKATTVKAFAVARNFATILPQYAVLRCVVGNADVTQIYSTRRHSNVPDL